MFGKRKQEHKHRHAEEIPGEPTDADAPREAGDDPELVEALLQLGRNRHSSLPEPQPQPQPPAAEEPTEPGEPAEPAEPADEALGRDDQGESAGSDAPDRPVWAAVQTAAMLAEPEPEPEPEKVEARPGSFGEAATYAAPRRGRSKEADQDAALQKAEDEVAALKAELKTLRTASSTDTAEVEAVTARADELEQSLLESRGRIEELTAEVDRLRSGAGAERERARPASSAETADEVRAAVERAEAAERSVAELQSRVSGLTAELERARSEAAAAGVALERVQREAKDQDGSVAAAEARAERLAAEIEQLRAAAAKGPAQVERLQREAERERTMRAALEQAQASQAKADAALADNLRLARELAANLDSQEGLIAALTGLQTEVTEQRAWFESQIASVSETENQQAGVIDALQTAIQDRDIELEVLRQQLLEAEAKRAEEAAAFVAALERQ